MTRREFLVGGATAAGALIVGYGLWPSRRLERANLLIANPGEQLLTTWIKIAKDGTITVVVPHCDMGTGIFTSLPQMAADELDADWTTVRAETAPCDPLFANDALVEGALLDRGHMTLDSFPLLLRSTAANSSRLLADFADVQTTGGSTAVRFTGVYGMRMAGAAAREMLVKAAAARMRAPVTEFRTEMSRVYHVPSQTIFGYGELAEEAAHYSPTARPQLKAAREFRFIGKSISRFDIPAKVKGAAQYGIDVRLPEMLYAAIRISPVFGGKLMSLNEAEALRLPGVRKVVRLDDAVVVVADRYWRAHRAVSALEPVFGDGNNGAVSSATIRDLHRAALNGTDIKKDMAIGAGGEALKNGTLLERTYSVPYLAHASLEPVNATALYHSEGTLEVWAGTQDGLGSRAFCAKAAGLSMDKVKFHLLPSGGGYGRRLPEYWNFLTYAVKAAMAIPGAPVKLIFTREQDLQHDYYRPNVTSHFRAAVASDGMPVAWVNDYTTDDGANSEAHTPYDIPNQAYRFAKVVTHVPTGPWRSVESSWHGFFVESFIDELANQAKRDPLEYRLALLKQKPRNAAVLKLAAEKANWSATLLPGRGRGIAVMEGFGSIIAQVAEVEVTENGVLKIHRFTCAADCGRAVNPDGFKAQMEGAIVFGLSAALSGEIAIQNGAVVQQNFTDYDVLRLSRCPEIEVYIQESDAPLGGAGEPGVPPVAPALTNAIFAATGIRIRDLPVSNHALDKAAQQVAKAGTATSELL